MTDEDLGIVHVDKCEKQVHSEQDDAGTNSNHKNEESVLIPALLHYFNSILVATMVLGYPLILMPLYRSTSTTDTMRLILCTLVHPIFAEYISWFQRRGKGRHHMEITTHKSYAHLTLSLMMTPGLVDCILIFYRRFLIGAIVDSNLAILAIVITGVEEAIFRCSMVYRDTWIESFMSDLAARDTTVMPTLPSVYEEETEKDSAVKSHLEQRKLEVWAISSANVMIYEVVAIIVAHVVYLSFRQHRFVINFGYGFDELDSRMTAPALSLIAMFLELFLEAVVDVAAVSIERRDGVDFSVFWKKWSLNPYAYFGDHVSIAVVGMSASIWAFSCIPSSLLCKAPDPCSCTGSGFEIYTPFCDLIHESQSSNSSDIASSTTAGKSNITAVSESAQAEYSGVGTFISKVSYSKANARSKVVLTPLLQS